MNQKTKKKRKINTDGIYIKRSKKTVSVDSLRREDKTKNYIIFLNQKRIDYFYVCDSKKYILTKKQRQEAYKKQCIAQMQTCYFDSIFVQNVSSNQKIKQNGVNDIVYDQSQNVLHNNSVQLQEYLQNAQKQIHNTYTVFSSYRHALLDYFNISSTRMWQVSLTSAMIIGMVSMNFLYNNFGQSVFAKDNATEQSIVVVDTRAKTLSVNDVVNQTNIQDIKIVDGHEQKTKVQESQLDVITNENVQKISDGVITREVIDDRVAQEIEQKVINDVVERKIAEIDQKIQQKNESETFEDIAYELVEGYPIEKMLPYILEQDREVAKYLIAIAMQESTWGKHVPVLNGQDCFNYWGYRGKRRLMGSGGHTCFNSRKDAVDTVGKRIHDLVYEYDRKTADRLIVWKCGRSCAGHSPTGVRRWIDVVDKYHDKLSLK